MSTYRWDGGFTPLEHRDGEHITVERPLNVPEEADAEVGPMFLVTFDDGDTAHVYLDEIEDQPPVKPVVNEPGSGGME